MSKAIKINPGERFGRLTVISEHGRIHKEIAYLCRCDCGKETVVASWPLRKGRTRSCGCLIADSCRLANSRHGLYRTRLHRTYSNMKNRCYNPNYHLFKRYGERGITVSDEWLGDTGFLSFYNWSMENGYKDDLSIDRIDNNKGYSPDNCRWTTMKVQQNNRSNNHIIEVNGTSKTLAQWEDFLNLKRGYFWSKARKHKNIDDVVRKEVLAHESC